MAVSEKTFSDKIENSSLEEELRKERENDDLVFNTKYSHKKDLENLLKLAEDLKEKFDYISSKIIRVKFLQFILVFSFFTYLFVGYYIAKESANTQILASREEAIKVQQDVVTDLSRKKNNLSDELKFLMDFNKNSDKISSIKNSDKISGIKERTNDIEQSIKSAENRIATLKTYSIPEMSFLEFVTMYEKIIPVLLALFLGFFVTFYLTSKYKHEISPEKTALTEVLQLLRETSDIVAKQEEWSVLSRAEFRIRLSRFNLEEKSKSAFNFFS